jgi:hypothetical protein
MSPVFDIFLVIFGFLDVFYVFCRFSELVKKKKSIGTKRREIYEKKEED